MTNMHGELHRRGYVYDQGTGAAPVQTYADEWSLVDLARGGSRAAYEELYGRHAKMLYHVVFRMTKNHEDTEDVLQEAAMKAFLHLDGFEGRSAFSSWLTRIAMNGVLMMRRKRRARHESSIEGSCSTEEIQIPDAAPGAEEQILKRETLNRVRRAIENLPPVLRVPLQHQLSEDLPVKDVADRLGISIPATKSRLRRARILVFEAVTRSHRRSGTRPSDRRCSTMSG